MILKNPIHEAELILSMILIQSEGTCYEHFLYSLDAAILSAVVHTILYTQDVLLTSPRTDIHLSTASYP